MLRLLLLLGLLAAGCRPAVSEPAWGPAALLGQAEQRHAPALWVEDSRLTAIWTGANATNVHFAARAITAGGISAATILALPARSPRDLALLPARGTDLNLLWLDVDDSNNPRLYTGRINPALEVVGTRTTVSDRPTYHYIATPNGDDTAWIVWSGGHPAEPALYAQLLNLGSRPLEAQFLTTDAAWPALNRASDGTLRLYWRRVSDGQVFGGTLLDGVLQNAQPLGLRLELQPGTILHGLHAGLDHAHQYLFWTITDPTGTTRTRYSSAPISGGDWSAPADLTMGLQTDSTIETGFNTGPAHGAAAGATPIAWALPLAGQSDLLPVAAKIGGDAGMIYMRGGQIAAAQVIATTQPPGLIGYPALAVDRARYLYLAWAQPYPGTAADLRLVSLGFNWQAGTPPGMR